MGEFFISGPPTRLPEELFPQLTAREREVLDLLAAGRSNAHIAQTLFLSPKTIRNNISNIFAKLHVADRAEAIVRARDAGMGRLCAALRHRDNQGTALGNTTGFHSLGSRDVRPRESNHNDRHSKGTHRVRPFRPRRRRARRIHSSTYR